ncbi:universal stress protein [Schaalia sp. Marseille-Q2122]|uniref:universal stress protein n=1 Tax=Schaalia sp. Marseille-Q2122 TaxID=2736604 RepID=UPI001588997C|nr:universal stress protein [Schaalia sp. Marseille-Q2122]
MSVVVSYYGNVESDVALSEAIAQASARNTSLVVVVDSGAQRSLGDLGENDQAQSRDEVEDRLWDALGGVTMSVDVRRPTSGVSMADTVLQAAVQCCAQVIVLGLRPGGSAGTHIGPTAAQILLDAPCPVVTTTTHLRREK